MTFSLIAAQDTQAPQAVDPIVVATATPGDSSIMQANGDPSGEGDAVDPDAAPEGDVDPDAAPEGDVDPDAAPEGDVDPDAAPEGDVDPK